MLIKIYDCKGELKSEKELSHFSKRKFTGLAYETNTNIVYYHVVDGAYGFMSPYLGIHGRPCQYSNGQIIELAKEV